MPRTAPHKKAIKYGITLGLCVLAISATYVVIKSPATAKIKAAQPKQESRDPAIQAGFVPHKALYDISLVGTKSGSQIVNVTGQMFYDWQSSCEGWISNHKFNLSYEYADSPAVTVSSDFSNFEAFDGSRLDFTSQRKRANHVFEEIRGQANIENADGAAKLSQASYTIPKGLTFDLPKGSLFPLAHTLQVKKAVEANRRFFTATVFDGSDEDGPVEINAFINKNKATPPASTKTSTEIDQTLLQSPAHSIRLAFFPMIETSAQSEYEMQMTFHDNSIISNMTVEYEDFTIKQTLVALEKREGNCAQ